MLGSYNITFEEHIHANIHIKNICKMSKYCNIKRCHKFPKQCK